MRKLTEQNIRHLKSHSKKHLRNRLKRKDKKYSGEGDVSKRKSTNPTRERIYFEDIEAPKKFNLKAENCEEFIAFVNKLKKYGLNRYNINILMEETTDIGEGAISMFLSVIDELTKNGIGVIGTKPKLIVERDKLEKSGFFKYMEGKIEAKNSITKNTILRTGGKSNTHIDLSFEIKNANETVWGTKGRNPPLRGTVFEMMRNSHDHAFKNENSVIWHLGISHDEENKQVKFSFVDNGRGIIKSFSEGFLGKLFNLFRDNCDLLETAFKNGIESRTGLSWRGKGLPTIFENYEEGYFKNLVVISNDVFIDFDKKIYKKLNVPFKGTYYFWLLNEECTKACYN